MKSPTFAPAYVGLFPILAECSHEHGYALAVHGSVSRDFDLIAIPWAEVTSDAETLIRAIAERMSYTMDTAIKPDDLFQPPYTEHKPHGRRSWCIPLDCGAYIDISVMPTSEPMSHCSKIFDHKWLNPACVENGCQSLTESEGAK